jgi:hypothetical protein
VIPQNVCTDLQRSHPRLTPVAHVADGAPEQALIDASTDAGLIVVGSQGRGAFQEMIAGSVSFAVIHGAHAQSQSSVTPNLRTNLDQLAIPAGPDRAVTRD